MSALPATRQGLRLLWQVVRYAVATGVATVVAAVPPLLLGALPFVGLVVWCLLWVIAFVVYVFTGKALDTDIEPIGIVFVPLTLALVGVLAVAAALILACAFGFVLVLPILLLTDLLGQRFAPRSPGLRLGILLLAGLALGASLAGALGLLTVLGVLSLSPTVLTMVALALASMALASVFAGGLVLNGLAWLGRRVGRRRRRVTSS